MGPARGVTGTRRPVAASGLKRGPSRGMHVLCASCRAMWCSLRQLELCVAREGEGKERERRSEPKWRGTIGAARRCKQSERGSATDNRRAQSAHTRRDIRRYAYDSQWKQRTSEQDEGKRGARSAGEAKSAGPPRLLRRRSLRALSALVLPRRSRAQASSWPTRLPRASTARITGDDDNKFRRHRGSVKRR